MVIFHSYVSLPEGIPRMGCQHPIIPTQATRKYRRSIPDIPPKKVVPPSYVTVTPYELY
jgi:hypothetical protein